MPPTTKAELRLPHICEHQAFLQRVLVALANRFTGTLYISDSEFKSAEGSFIAVDYLAAQGEEPGYTRFRVIPPRQDYRGDV